MHTYRVPEELTRQSDPIYTDIYQHSSQPKQHDIVWNVHVTEFMSNMSPVSTKHTTPLPCDRYIYKYIYTVYRGTWQYTSWWT